MTTPETKIVIVAGTEHSVPANVDNEQIRQYLQANGYPDVANAEIKPGKKTIDGVTYSTIEFVKKAGTKGLDLAALLADVPPTRVPAFDVSVIPAALRRLIAEQLTMEQALSLNFDALLTQISEQRSSVTSSEGDRLCTQLELLPATPAASRVVGW